jgi:hypothetical protein
MFLMATLDDGRQVISEFDKLSKVQQYAQKVFSGTDTFNAWKVVSRVHPASGEAVLIREREVISGRHIVSVQQVVPKSDLTVPHDYEPSRFQPALVTKEGEHGLWRVPASTVIEREGVIATPDVDYPVHRDPRYLRDYVILRAGNEGDGIEEVRYYTDDRPAPATPSSEESPVGEGFDDDDLDDDLDDGEEVW